MNKVKVKIVGKPIINGKVSDSAILTLPIPPSLTELALSHDADDWDSMCKQLPDFGLMNPIGKVSISHLLVDGKERVFH